MFFTSSELKLIMAKCPGELKNFLYMLDVNSPDDVEGALCSLMKSKTVYGGYTSMLKAGGISYSHSDTENELLGRIIANRQDIAEGCMKKRNAVSQNEFVVASCDKVTDTKKNDMQELFRRIKEIETIEGIFKQRLFDNQRIEGYRREMEDLMNKLDRLISALPNTGINRTRSVTYNEAEMIDLLCSSNDGAFIVERTGIISEPALPSFSFEEISYVLNVLEQAHKIFQRI